MTKETKSSFILFVAFACIIMAWHTLENFFGGTGISFVALVLIMSAVVILAFGKSKLFSRIKDLFILSCVLLGLEFFIYFFFELGIGGHKFLSVLWAIQSVITFLGICFFGWTMFRFICELKGKKIDFVESMLSSPAQFEPKKKRELSNGSLEDKPNHEEAEEHAETEEKKEDFSREPNDTEPDIMPLDNPSTDENTEE